MSEEIRLTTDGRWLSNGEEITHAETVRAFFRGIARAPEGGWEIRIGPERKAIQVEDCALFVVRIEGSPEDGYALTLSNGETQPLVPASLEYSAPGRLITRVRLGNAEETARFLKNPYEELLFRATEGPDGVRIQIRGQSYRIAD